MPTNIHTIGRWLHIPTSGGANDRLRADQPLSSGTMQILASNAEWGARCNNLRTLWEHPGEGNIAGVLGYGTSAGAGTDIDSFDWDADPFNAGTVRSYFAGWHRIRPWGSTGQWPRVALSAMASNGGSATTRIILCGRPAVGRPQPGDLFGTATTTSSTPVSISAVISPTSGYIGTRLVAPMDESAAAGTPPAESGRETAMAFYVGVCTSGAGKADVRAMTLHLAPP